MLAGVKFEEDEDEDNIPSSQQLDKNFGDIVVKYPIGEELVLRGVLQPLISKILVIYKPHLAAPSLLNIPQANVISAVSLGILFGFVHYFNYKSGGIQVALIGSISGSFYGIIKERFNLAAPIAAHMTHNFLVGLLDKHYPAFLDSSL